MFESITHQIKNYQNLYETLRARRCDTTSGRLIRLKPSGSIYLSICKLENAAILRDFLIFYIFLNLTTLKTKLFSETSSIFEFDNTKNEATLRDFLQGSKVECRAQFPNVLRTWCVLCILTSKCASRHNGVHFFNVSSPKSAPKLVRCAFLLRIVLRAATVQLSSDHMAPHPPL